ncbi:MAG: 3-hydroxylacyl-ACP dehydratase [Treponema sp.]|nr:3-hydroxylacyl-ACP dehydratase [Treponema sp.]
MMFTADNLPQHIEKDELINLVPHKGKMFLLSRVISHDTVSHFIETEYDVTEDCIFYDKEAGGVPSFAGFEIMAQGISALSSLERIANKVTEPPKPGVVLSISSFESDTAVFKSGTTLRMKVQEEYRGDGIFKYDCSLFTGEVFDKPSVTVCITVMEMNNMELFFKEGQKNG